MFNVNDLSMKKNPIMSLVLVLVTVMNLNAQVSLDGLIYLYKNDKRGRLIERTIPGAGVEYNVYDKKDRLVLSQTANQRARTEWGFVKYDIYDRPILEGVVVISGTREQVQQQVDDFYAASNPLYESVGGSIHGYTNDSYPVLAGQNEVNSVNYYDNYDFLSYWSEADKYALKNVTEVDVTVNYPLPEGQLTGRKTKILNSADTYLKGVTYYDEYSRTIQSISDNILGGVDIHSFQYNFLNNVIADKKQHNEYPQEGARIATLSRTEYDHQQRAVNAYRKSYEPTWTELVGCYSVNPGLLERDSTLTAGWGASGAFSKEKLTEGNDGWVEFEMPDMTDYIAAGLSADNPDAHYNSIDYAFYVRPYSGGTRVAYVIENGVFAKSLGYVGQYDKFKIERINGTVYYKVNDQVVHTSANASATDLYVDAAHYPSSASKKTRLFTSVSFGEEVLLANNKYNALGEVIENNIHSTDGGANFLQSVDYRYNINGFLTHINNAERIVDGTNDDSNDLFGMQLYYETLNETGSNTGKYNGMVSSQSWGTPYLKEGGIPIYNYTYDKINRLKSALFVVK